MNIMTNLTLLTWLLVGSVCAVLGIFLTAAAASVNLDDLLTFCVFYGQTTQSINDAPLYGAVLLTAFAVLAFYISYQLLRLRTQRNLAGIVPMTISLNAVFIAMLLYISVVLGGQFEALTNSVRTDALPLSAGQVAGLDLPLSSAWCLQSPAARADQLTQTLTTGRVLLLGVVGVMAVLTLGLWLARPSLNWLLRPRRNALNVCDTCGLRGVIAATPQEKSGCPLCHSDTTLIPLERLRQPLAQKSPLSLKLQLTTQRPQGIEAPTLSFSADPRLTVTEVSGTHSTWDALGRGRFASDDSITDDTLTITLQLRHVRGLGDELQRLPLHITLLPGDSNIPTQPRTLRIPVTRSREPNLRGLRV
jgi:hypothetical protein